MSAKFWLFTRDLLGSLHAVIMMIFAVGHMQCLNARPRLALAAITESYAVEYTTPPALSVPSQSD